MPKKWRTKIVYLKQPSYSKIFQLPWNSLANKSVAQDVIPSVFEMIWFLKLVNMIFEISTKVKS